MRFYDRKRELERLNSIREVALRDHSQLVALTGRRRIGKTSLILKSCEHQPLSVYPHSRLLGSSQRSNSCLFHCQWIRLYVDAPSFYGHEGATLWAM